MKSNIVVIDKYDIALPQMSIVKQGKYWQKLVITDDKISILFSANYPCKIFQITDLPFLI